MNCTKCKKELDFDNEPVWEVEDDIVCDECMELCTDKQGEKEAPVRIIPID